MHNTAQINEIRRFVPNMSNVSIKQEKSQERAELTTSQAIIERIQSIKAMISDFHEKEGENAHEIRKIIQKNDIIETL